MSPTNSPQTHVRGLPGRKRPGGSRSARRRILERRSRPRDGVACALVAADEVVAEARNPEGRLVRLGAVAWGHVLREHAEMAGYLGETMNAVESPDHREPDPRAGRERYFRRGGPLIWIRVVTEFRGGADNVVTAFPQSNDPS